MDIGTEELSHLEILGALARLHLKPMKFDRESAEADPLIAIAGGGGVNLYNSMGNAWAADYLKITGELDVDLRSNIAAEAAKAKPCKGMAGLIEEGEEVIEAGKEKDGVAADLALIAVDD